MPRKPNVGYSACFHGGKLGGIGKAPENSGFVPDGTCCVYTGTGYAKIRNRGHCCVKLGKIAEYSGLRIRRIQGLCRPQLGEFGFCAVQRGIRGAKTGRIWRYSVPYRSRAGGARVSVGLPGTSETARISSKNGAELDFVFGFVYVCLPVARGKVCAAG